MNKISKTLISAALFIPFLACEVEAKNTTESGIDKASVAKAKVINYEGLTLGMKKADALKYIDYDKIYKEYYSALQYLYGGVTKEDVLEKGLPQNFFKLENHIPLGAKRFDLLQLSFTSSDELLWKISLSFVTPEKKDDEIALRAALKTKFKVNSLGEHYLNGQKLISVALLDENLTKKHLEDKSNKYLSEL